MSFKAKFKIKNSKYFIALQDVLWIAKACF